MSTAAKPKAGLEDTVATSSAICYLDGDRGVLAYCGYDIHDLARHAHLRRSLLSPVAPAAADARRAGRPAVAADRRAARCPKPVLRLMRALPDGNTMDALRNAHVRARPLRSRRGRPVAAGQLPQGRPSDGANQLARRDARPDEGRRRSHPAGSGARARREFLYMLTGERPSGLATRAFDVALILHADHELNASTFARARRRGHAHRHPLGHRRARSAR